MFYGTFKSVSEIVKHILINMTEKGVKFTKDLYVKSAYEEDYIAVNIIVDEKVKSFWASLPKGIKTNVFTRKIRNIFALS